METADFLVIGGGVIGCSLARELARVSGKVVLLERGRVGCGSSSAAAGLLAPGVSTAPAGPLIDLCYESASLYEAWVEDLRLDGAGDVGFARSGLLEVWTAPARTEEHRRDVADRMRPGGRVDLLSAAEVLRGEPALAAGVVGGAFYPDAAQVDPARLTRGVARVAALAGVVSRENEPVLRLVREGDRIAAGLASRSG
jgi:glycine oxidase